jgi:hypothetical protein
MKSRHLLALLAIACWAWAGPALAQSQAVNGSIEGTVKDILGGVLPGVTVTLVNLDTGTQRVVVTNSSGVYRAALLPLGKYKLRFELNGFAKLEQTEVELTAGLALVLNETLKVGTVSEAVTVTSETPAIDLGKIDMGRNINEREVKNLPLVSRNPYNFALLEPGVIGNENSEFGVPRFSANGALLRINYQVDGNSNTQKDRAGLRLMPMSEVMISEVKVVTSGYAPEFGQTTGVVYNAITPSGTNTTKGDGAYRFRRTGMTAAPYFLAAGAAKPQENLDIVTGDVGGPIIKDKLHYYGGFEHTYRDMQRVITIDSAVAASVGVPPQPGAVPAYQSVTFFIGKGDWQLKPGQAFTVRLNTFKNNNPYNAGSGGNTAMSRSADYWDKMFSLGGQLVSTMGASRLNELRVQWAQRHNKRFANSDSGTGPAINISGSISFGGPLNDGEDFQQDIYQFIDNFTLMHGNHSFKAGLDYQYVKDHRAVNETATFAFTTVAAYNAALSGAAPYGYSTFGQTVGVPTLDFTDGLFSGFVQDDWRVSADFKAVYGVRYDVYLYPNGVPNATYPLQQHFNIDKNNFAPRLGFAWTLGSDKKTVLRASTGMMYDQPLLAIVEQAYTQSSNPARITVNLNGTGNSSGASPGAPPFPSTLSNPPPGYTIPLSSRTIFAMDPNFVTGRTFQNNIQLQRGIGRDYSAAIGFIYSKGYNLPVVLDTNLLATGTFLADGRNVFSTAVNAATRVDPNYNHISVAQSVGDSTYKGLTLQFTRRWSHNIQYDLNYTFARGVDNAVMTTTLAQQGDDPPSDPLNLERDRGPNALDIHHTFNTSVVAMSSWHRGNKAVQQILSNNQVGLILQFNSGSDFTVRSNTDLNKDGTGNDRPLNVTRNSMYLPPRYNTNLRYSRFFTLSGARRFEFQAEFQNLFNTLQVSGVNRTINVNADGSPQTAIPATGGDFPGTSAYEQRKFQMGFKFYF